MADTDTWVIDDYFGSLCNKMQLMNVSLEVTAVVSRLF